MTSLLSRLLKFSTNYFSSLRHTSFSNLQNREKHSVQSLQLEVLQLAVGPVEGRVVEVVGGAIKVHDAPLGVITNSPAYDWHMTNLRNYVNLSVQNPAPITIEGVELTKMGQGPGMLGLQPRQLLFGILDHRGQTALAEHETIYQALCAHDAVAAKRAMKHHLKQTHKRYNAHWHSV